MNYLGCVSDETLSGETTALRVIEKINSKLKFFYRKNWFLDVPFRRLLWNALVQPHFVYAYAAWFSSVTKKLKDELQVTKNKGVRFCLKLKCRKHISNERFERRKWQPINQELKHCASSTVFKFVHNKCPLE